MKTFINNFLLLFFLFLMLFGECFGGMQGLSENQLRGFVGSEKVCFEKALTDCDKSKEMKLVMKMDTIDSNQLNELTTPAENSLFETVTVDYSIASTGAEFVAGDMSETQMGTDLENLMTMELPGIGITPAQILSNQPPAPVFNYDQP